MYDLLEGIRVLEVAIAAPGGLGAHLAAMGAEVIKIEKPLVGDTTRLLDDPFTNAFWNAGKKSVALDLEDAEAQRIALDLARSVDVFVDGLRAGAIDELGLTYEAVRGVNPSVVYCSLSGMGQTGPYRRLAVHAPAFDAFAGIAPVAFREDGLPCMGAFTSVGTQAGALFAAFAVAAALVKALRRGKGQYIDVAQIDAAALWRGQEIARGLQRGWGGRSQWRAKDAVRGQFYETSDGKYVAFQPLEEKFWQNFCRAIHRPDLAARTSGKPTDLAIGDEDLRRELVEIMKAKTQAAWVDFFIEHNVPGGPVHTIPELLEDPHFQARRNLAEIDHPRLGRMLMPTTPIKLPDQVYELSPAPDLGEHTEEVLATLPDFDANQLAALRARGVAG